MELAIGTANFGNQYGINKAKLTFQEIKKILNFAKKKNIKYLDTSFNYGDSIKILSKFNLKDFHISSKFFITKESKIDSVISQIKSNLKILKIEKFENLMIHNFYQLTKKEIIKNIPLLLIIKKEKLTKNIGISVYDPKELDVTWGIWRPDLVQFPLNILDRRFLNSKWIDKLKNNKIKIHARSIFLQGLLLNNTIVNRMSKKYIKNFSTWSLNNKIKKSEACINFIKSIKKVNRVILGVENSYQLSELHKYFLSKNKYIYPKKNYTYNMNIIDPRRW
jgi:aryl-alcohol dehydrogenase-like predicted oxidoreductase